ncbi:MAG: hypothetical protein M8860_05300 [marine benthic group bacterium]|jgi:hypothetical protein|nr:hypothetical protein [Candidatus Carthagonibacter metallireducens]
MRALRRTLPLVALLLVAFSIPAIAQEEGRTNNRNGLWGGLGLGYGILGLLDCPSGFTCDTEGGLSGNARIGFTPSQSFRVALGSNSWVDTGEGRSSNIGLLSAQGLYYPGAKNFFLLGGAGLALATCSGCSTETGAGIVLGLGYDIPLNQSGSLALTPYVNWVPTTLEFNPYILQFGLGLTFN